MSLQTTTGLSVAQPAPLACAGCAIPHHQTKRTILFVCLPWHCYLLQCGCSLFFSILHGMHLVVPTYPYFFWAICHPSRTFPPKEPKQEPQNMFSPLPTVRSYPLTSDPWPTTSYIGWVQVGEVWALRVLDFCVCSKLAHCICRGLEALLHILPPILDFLWRELLSNSSFSMAYSL